MPDVLRSFGHTLDGLVHLIQTQRNFRFHLGAGLFPPHLQRLFGR